MSIPATADVVLVDTIQLAANIGKDCWDRERNQIVLLSIYLHLSPTFLNKSGKSDDVQDSVHYGHLTKVISSLVSDGKAFDDVHALIDEATQAAFKLAGDYADAVRVVVDLPKQILLADGFSMEVTTPKGAGCRDSPTIVRVKDLVLPVLIGVNPPERLARQRVITNITFYQKAGPVGPIDYPNIVKKIASAIDQTDYETLEKFVLEIVQSGLAAEGIEAVTARSQKPSALSFAHSSGVEITRRREIFA
ncbi:hypothetical protein HYDPIDRAFT_90621 [Hydnomerulius pinastri MD-312]|uniref:dihydroneopterin aldolase n=1 Tax=Hydnomerulius pinastri MD-312 TaxID=994086 RepID=A0A0C9WFJ6_9AGAM|nr:hypothetical protein HYDPIDRAFT_90621 [Hydnomerulius pinastri MD-312]